MKIKNIEKLMQDVNDFMKSEIFVKDEKGQFHDFEVRHCERLVYYDYSKALGCRDLDIQLGSCITINEFFTKNMHEHFDAEFKITKAKISEYSDEYCDFVVALELTYI